MKLLCKILVAGTMFLLFQPTRIEAQISAPGSAFYEPTVYPVTPENDPLFIFCTTENGKAATLRVISSLEGPKTWLWEKFNPVTTAFEFHQTESNSNGESQITGLSDGCYRATVTAGGVTQVYRAWVFNNWNSAGAAVGESNCDFFTLDGTIGQAQLAYFDLQSGAQVNVLKNVQVKWWKGEDIISALQTYNVYDPPAIDTEYSFVVTDRFGCEATAKVLYRSIVTKAAFTADKMNGEAPLLVTFTNSSENGDPGSYEWFFFRDLDDIKRESEKTTLPIDSIMLVAVDDNPVYEFENSGTYMVKLVSKKRSDFHLCTDTFYLEDYIVADTSFVEVPNIFTPDGDNTNDNFVVKFWSMQSLKVSLFNRWGRTVHVWEKGNIRGFEKTWLESVWDGRIGGRMASPGVYFYVIEGVGRDGVKRWKHGNVYLMRGKD